jgi:hypothetical protein
MGQVFWCEKDGQVFVFEFIRRKPKGFFNSRSGKEDVSFQVCYDNSMLDA